MGPSCEKCVDAVVRTGTHRVLLKDPEITEVLLSIWARHARHRLPILLA
jgi:hypothetical protein